MRSLYFNGNELTRVSETAPAPRSIAARAIKSTSTSFPYVASTTKPAHRLPSLLILNVDAAAHLASTKTIDDFNVCAAVWGDACPAIMAHGQHLSATLLRRQHYLPSLPRLRTGDGEYLPTHTLCEGRPPRLLR